MSTQARRLPGMIDLLRQADIFYQVPMEYLDKIVAICQEITCQTGEKIFLEGTNSDELYIITQGEVEIRVNPSLVGGKVPEQISPITITTLRRGQSFGEVALVDQGVRSATACATLDNTHLLLIPRRELLKLCDKHPIFGYRLMRNLAADLAMKLRNTDFLIRAERLCNTNPQ
jgi:CRP/FNR family cyclic AMP-dependent transcriptional regulator